MKPTDYYDFTCSKCGMVWNTPVWGGASLRWTIWKLTGRIKPKAADVPKEFTGALIMGGLGVRGDLNVVPTQFGTLYSSHSGIRKAEMIIPVGGLDPSITAITKPISSTCPKCGGRHTKQRCPNCGFSGGK
jgi:hypothetical protein